jgi:signal transduction histidine kinase
MGYKRFNLNIVVRIVLIVITAIWFGIELQNEQKAYTKFLCILLLVLQSAALFYYLNKMNSEIVRFLQLLNINDSAYRFSSNLKGNFSELAKILNNTADLIIDGRIERERQYQFLQFVIEQINIGLVAFNNNGDIQYINSAFEKLLKIKRIKSINELKNVNIELVNKLTVDQPVLAFQLRLIIDNEPVQIFVQKEQIKINNEYINLVSLQNITAELDKKELDSWQKLIRVLTHEIMNSIAPITNLTYSIRRSLNENINTIEDQSETIKEAIEDIEIIEKRSESLMQFVKNYRKLTQVGILNIAKTNISEVILNSVNIFKNDFKSSEVKCILNLDDGIKHEIDDKLLEQAIINLLKNAFEAVKEIKAPEIEISLKRLHEDIIISIIDNGKGIEVEKLDDIFIPFYTTKEKGTGIGLSLVKQIINLHKGTISVISKINEGTTFKIKL